MGGMPDFEGLAVFARVAELRSFASAATSLGLSPATVSKVVSRLEERLNVTLLHRSTRALSLTPTGHALVARASALLSEGEAAEDVAREEAVRPRGLVRIAAPMSFGLRFVAPLLPELHRLLPEVSFDLQLSDATTDLVADGFDLAIRIGWPRDSALLARKLCDVPSIIAAAPSYLQERGEPLEPADLAKHVCLAYAHVPPADRWHLVDREGREATVTVKPLLITNNGDAMLPLLCAGAGIMVIPEFAVRKDLDAGRLRIVLAGWSMPVAGLYLVTPSSGPRSARVGAVLAFLRDRLARVCGP